MFTMIKKKVAKNSSTSYTELINLQKTVVTFERGNIHYLIALKGSKDRQILKSG